MSNNLNLLKNTVRGGVGVIVTKGETILLGKRMGSHGAETWSFPGGHLEFGETPEETALREVKEETGLTVVNPRILTFTNDIFTEEKKHYITIFVQVEYTNGEVKNMEPDKCLEWRWFPKNNLPEPLFLPIQNLLKQIKSIKIL